jgi:hypothetical protein
MLDVFVRGMAPGETFTASQLRKWTAGERERVDEWLRLCVKANSIVRREVRSANSIVVYYEKAGRNGQLS